MKQNFAFINSLSNTKSEDSTDKKSEREVKIIENPAVQPEKESKVSGFVSLADVAFFLCASGSVLIPILWALMKLGLHGTIILYEIYLSFFARQSEANYQGI